MGIKVELNRFQEAVQNNRALYANDLTGQWAVRWRITQLFRWLFGLEVQDDIQLATYFTKYVKAHEVRSRVFQVDPLRTQEQLQQIEDTAQLLVARLQKHMARGHAKVTREALHKTISTLQRHIVACNYRHTPQVNIHVDTASAAFTQDRDWLLGEVTKFKVKYQQPSAFSLEEMSKIIQTCHYPQFIALLRADKVQLEDFLRFVFRATLKGCDDAVHIAVQFPECKSRITDSYLDKRLKRVKNNGLRMHELPPSADAAAATLATKDVTLLINKQHVSILDERRQITFDGGVTITLKELFKVFHNKKYDLGNYEYLLDGILLCYPKQPLVDLSKADWWKDLPQFEILTRVELNERFFPPREGEDASPPRADFSTGYALIAARASREGSVKRVDGTHAWLDIFLPLPDGRFSLLSIGKYRTFFDNNALETIVHNPGTDPAMLTIPDENNFYYQRKHCAVPFVAAKEEVDTLLEKIREDLNEVRKGNMVFQPQGNNCSPWVQQCLDVAFEKRGRELPRYFHVDVLTTEGPLNIPAGFNAIREKTSHTFANFLRVAFCTIWGGLRGMEVVENGKRKVKRLINYPSFLKGVLSLPATLFTARDAIVLDPAP